MVSYMSSLERIHIYVKITNFDVREGSLFMGWGAGHLPNKQYN